MEVLAHTVSHAFPEILAKGHLIPIFEFVRSFRRIPASSDQTCKRGGRLQAHVLTIRSFD